MWVGLLGPLLIRDDAAELPAGPAKQRVVLAALGLRPGRVVSVAELCGISWDDAPRPPHRCRFATTSNGCGGCSARGICWKPSR